VALSLAKPGLIDARHQADAAALCSESDRRVGHAPMSGGGYSAVEYAATRVWWRVHEARRGKANAGAF
jgi:hypothetical protein